MGRIDADIAPESWLFGFRPCSGQGQFILLKWHNLGHGQGQNLNSQLSSAISASILPIELQDYIKIINPFTGPNEWVDHDLNNSVGKIGADIALQS